MTTTNVSRRRFLSSVSSFGFAATFGHPVCQALDQQSPTGPFKRCLMLWMEGGPSQQDTFDPKASVGGRPSIATNIAEVHFAETLSQLAGRADQLCMVRSVGSREGEHARATELMHTGFSPLPSFPRPALGSMIASDREDPGFPRYVTLGGVGFGPAFLGSPHGPFVIEDLDSAKNQLERVGRQRRSLHLLNQLNQLQTPLKNSDALSAQSAAIDSVRQLLDTRFPEAIDLNAASPSDLSRYGDHPFGRRVLAARRLLELDVPFVEAQLSGWDTHIDNNRRTASLCKSLQQPWIALMDDLQRTGRWDDTLIVWMGEFGRTPRLNGRAGRDHFPEVTPVILAGGNLGGRVIGATNDDGSARIGEKHSVSDLMATLLELLGLDHQVEYTTDFGSPTTATDNGKPIKEIITI